MREDIKKTEKEPQKIHPPKFADMEKAGDHTLKLAAVLKKWKIKRTKFWMRGLFWLFSVLYLALCSIPVYFAWAERYTFKNGLSEGGKVFLTVMMAVVAVGCIYVAWYQYWRWAKNYD